MAHLYESIGGLFLFCFEIEIRKNFKARRAKPQESRETKGEICQ